MPQRGAVHRCRRGGARRRRVHGAKVRPRCRLQQPSQSHNQVHTGCCWVAQWVNKTTQHIDHLAKADGKHDRDIGTYIHQGVRTGCSAGGLCGGGGSPTVPLLEAEPVSPGSADSTDAAMSAADTVRNWGSRPLSAAPLCRLGFTRRVPNRSCTTRPRCGAAIASICVHKEAPQLSRTVLSIHTVATQGIAPLQAVYQT